MSAEGAGHHVAGTEDDGVRERGGAESKMSTSSLDTEDLPSSSIAISRPPTSSQAPLAEEEQGQARPEGGQEEEARTPEPALQAPVETANSAAAQDGAAQEPATSEAAPSSGEAAAGGGEAATSGGGAAQAPQPVEGAGDATFGKRISQRRSMPPPVDLSKVNEETERASQEAALQEAQASRPGSTQPPASQSSSVTPVSRRSSIASGSDGPRRRSPQSDQLRQKMVEELCARSAHASARYGNNAKLQDLITANAALCNDKDSAGFTPLHFAACYNHHPALALLISAKADADALNEHGWTPLHVAARNGHHKCVTAVRCRERERERERERRTRARARTRTSI